MKGHGGEKHKENAEAFLQAARKLHATTKLHRQVYMHAGLCVEAMMLACGVKARSLMSVPLDEHGARWHDLPFLAAQRGLLAPLEADGRLNRQLTVHWLTVRDWQSEARFADIALRSQDALDMLNAVGHNPNGIFQWLLNRYETI